MTTPTLFEFGPPAELVADLAAGKANEVGLALVDEVLKAEGIEDEELSAALGAQHGRRIGRLLQDPKQRRLLAAIQARAGLQRLGHWPLGTIPSHFGDTRNWVRQVAEVLVSQLKPTNETSVQVYMGLESSSAPSGVGDQCTSNGYLHASGAGGQGAGSPVDIVALNKTAMELLNSGAITKFNELRSQHPEWMPDLSGAYLHEANLRAANLRAANLRAANLHRADLRGADLHKANLRGANLHRANLHEADLRGADLRGADLLVADLRGADLRGADLHKANLLGASLFMANLHEANLHEANLRAASLRAANLRGAKGLTKKQLGMALTIEGVKVTKEQVKMFRQAAKVIAARMKKSITEIEEE